MISARAHQTNVLYSELKTNKKFSEIVNEISDSKEAGDCNAVVIGDTNWSPTQPNVSLDPRIVKMVPSAVCGIGAESLRGIVYVLSLFVQLGLLYLQDDNTFDLFTGRSFGWTNVQMITEYDVSAKFKGTPGYAVVSETLCDTKCTATDVAQVIKFLFWYLRKWIVDTILNVSILVVEARVITDPAESKLYAVSVGSTRVTSDYDITLYGDHRIRINSYKVCRRYYTKCIQ